MMLGAARVEGGPPPSTLIPPLWRNPETGNLEGRHLMVVGSTGFGKSYFMKTAIEERAFVVVHDGKRTFREKPEVRNDERWEVCETFKAAFKSKSDRICYSPSNRELRDLETQNDFFDWILLRGSTLCAIDELTKVAKGQYMPPALDDIYATGRELGVEIVALTQMPVDVPNICFSQSRAFAIFYSALRSHRDKICGFVPLAQDQIAALPAREFYLYQDDWRGARGPYKVGEEGALVSAVD